MLTIHQQTSAAAVKKYFEVADYYSQGQETVGLWGGKLAAEWGLSGIVSKEAFERLCDNLHPVTGERLTLRTKDNRRIGYDFTFSGPKSFAIIWGLASEEERALLVKDFNNSVEEVMREIEADMRTRVRKGGAFEDRITGNMGWAGYAHTTARPVDGMPPDMQVHSHIFVFNATWDAVEGCHKAGEFGDIKKAGEYFTAVFYSRLAARLADRGYAIDRRGGKGWEIAGVPESAIATFSKRSGQVEAEHANRLDKDHADYDPDYRADYKHELGAKTRSKKQKEMTMPELRDAWNAQLSDGERDALARVYAKEIPIGPKITASQAVAYAIHHCFERESVIPERELKRVALLYGLGSVSPEDIAAELPRQGVLTGEKDGRTMATTAEVHRLERSITGFAKAGLGTVEAVGVSPKLERGFLDGDQWKAVTGLLTSFDRVQLVDSAAGVGKSTMLGVFDQGMRLAGSGVTYLATTTPAVGVLRKDGFDADTVAKFLLSEKMQVAAKGSHVVIDESSMLGIKDAARLFEIAKAKDIRLIFLGDSRQHASVAAGAVMRLLQEYGGVKPYRITDIKRQENAEHRSAVKLMFEGKTAEGFDLLDKKLEWVKEIRDDAERYRSMASEYVDAVKAGIAWDQILLLSPTHAEGQKVMAAVRGQMREAGLIGKDDHAFTRWVAADLTEAQRGDARNYQPGKVDMLQFHQNAAGHKSGTRLAISDANRPSLPLKDAGKFQAYRKESVAFATGDVLRFTANGKTLDGHQIRNGSAYQIAGFTAKGIRLDNGWLVAKEFGHFKHGIETSPGSQAKTVKRAIVGQSSHSFGASSMEQAYVSISRAKARVTIYTDDKAALRQSIQRSSLKLAAHDLIKPAAPPPLPPAARWRRRLTQWQRSASLARLRSPEMGGTMRQTQPERQVDHGYGR